MAIISISAALIAVRFDHWISGKREYRRAISSVRDEVADNISTCENNRELIDTDVNALNENKMGVLPYLHFDDLAWSTWKSVILLRNSELAGKIGAAYVSIPTVNRTLNRIEESKWGIAASPNGEAMEKILDMAKGIIIDVLLPRLEAVRKVLEEESEKVSRGWLGKRF